MVTRSYMKSEKGKRLKMLGNVSCKISECWIKAKMDIHVGEIKTSRDEISALWDLSTTANKDLRLNNACSGYFVLVYLESLISQRRIVKLLVTRYSYLKKWFIGLWILVDQENIILLFPFISFSNILYYNIFILCDYFHN